MSDLLEFARLHWRDGIEVLILAAIIYHLYRYFRATRGARILTGLVLLILTLTLIANLLELKVLGWLLSQTSFFLGIALVVIFQPELRRALADIGSSRIFNFNAHRAEFVDQLSSAMEKLSHKRHGALFAIERDIVLKAQAETGIEIDAAFSDELIESIFHPKTALHDGGVILTNGRINAAGCVFPVSQRELSDRSLGLRHRAGMGVSEESDAIAALVSEETGKLSLCHGGVLENDLSPEELRNRLRELLEDRPLDEEDGEGEGRDDGSATTKKKKKKIPTTTEDDL